MHRTNRMRDLFRAQGPLLVLIAAMFAIYLLQVFPGVWDEPFKLVPGAVTKSWQALGAGEATLGDFGRFGTLLSCAFLHGSPEHVLLNMLYLWIFAALAAELLGHRWVFVIFAFTAITGSIVHTVLNADEFIPCIGASGAVMGFEGVYLGMAIRWRLPDPHVWPIAHPIAPSRLALLGVIGIFLDLGGLMGHSESNTAYGAHIGGFVGGLLLAALVLPKPRAAGSH